MITDAIHLPDDALLAAFTLRETRRQEALAICDTRYGAERIRISSYMENIGWPELFGFRMEQFFADADFNFTQHLRQQIFWVDNVPDDGGLATWIFPDVGMYWDMTLFGAEIRHSSIGVPEFLPHPIAEKADLKRLGAFDFYTTGLMPKLIAKYQRMQARNRELYGGKFHLVFPSFHRGPLDIYVQLRGYENFLDDVNERPEFLREALLLLAEERARFAQARRQFLGEAALPATTFVADDWVNIPFISPTIFRTFAQPVYARIRELEGPVTGFHTCGRLEAVISDLLTVFPEMTGLDVSGWNDVLALDRAVDPHIDFGISFINTVTLSDDIDEQRAILKVIRAVGTRRKVGVCAQAIVKLYPTYDETIARLQRFIELARRELQEA